MSHCSRKLITFVIFKKFNKSKPEIPGLRVRNPFAKFKKIFVKIIYFGSENAGTWVHIIYDVYHLVKNFEKNSETNISWGYYWKKIKFGVPTPQTPSEKSQSQVSWVNFRNEEKSANFRDAIVSASKWVIQLSLNGKNTVIRGLNVKISTDFAALICEIFISVWIWRLKYWSSARIRYLGGISERSSFQFWLKNRPEISWKRKYPESSIFWVLSVRISEEKLFKFERIWPKIITNNEKFFHWPHQAFQKWISLTSYLYNK